VTRQVSSSPRLARRSTSNTAALIGSSPGGAHLK
jgi:hypothetical protein